MRSTPPPQAMRNCSVASAALAADAPATQPTHHASAARHSQGIARAMRADCARDAFGPPCPIIGAWCVKSFVLREIPQNWERDYIELASRALCRNSERDCASELTSEMPGFVLSR